MKLHRLALVATIVAAPACAQIPRSDVLLAYEPSIPARIEAMPRELPRARGPDLMYSLQLAQGAVDACASRGERVSARVADTTGTTVVLLSGDGAGERSQLITSVAASAAARYRLSSAELADKARSDTQLMKVIRQDLGAEVIRSASLLLMNGAQFVGVLAVAGAPGVDAACAKEALAKHPLPSAPAASAAATNKR